MSEVVVSRVTGLYRATARREAGGQLGRCGAIGCREWGCRDGDAVSMKTITPVAWLTPGGAGRQRCLESYGRAGRPGGARVAEDERGGLRVIISSP